MTRIRDRHRPQRDNGDKRWFGLILLIIGSIVLLKKLDLFYFNWHTMWPWILIVIGLLLGIKHKFRSSAPFILITIGVAHLIPVFEIFGTSSKELIIPAIIIGVGLIFLLRPGRKKKRWQNKCDDNVKVVTSDDNLLNIDVTFGGHKEIVTSKNFQGGRVSTTFGGTEVNMINADSIDKTITIDARVMFGEIELIVPSHWQLQNDISSTLGSVEDKRSILTQPVDTANTITLVLSGSCTFGSVEIKSY